MKGWKKDSIFRIVALYSIDWEAYVEFLIKMDEGDDWGEKWEMEEGQWKKGIEGEGSETELWLVSIQE